MVIIEGTGQAVITATRDGDEDFYPISAQVTIDVSKRNLSNVSIQSPNNLTYTGIAQTPNIIVTDGASNLITSEDFEVSFTNNINAGTATATITATASGNYSGTADTTFTIVQAPLTITGFNIIRPFVDGNFDVTLWGNLTFAGLQNGEFAVVDTDNVAGVFGQYSIGTNIPITFTGEFSLLPGAGSPSANPANYIITQPTGLTGTITQATGTFVPIDPRLTTFTTTLTLSDVALPNGYVWVNPTTPLVVANSGQDFPAVFTDPSGNFLPADGYVTVNVARADGVTVAAPTIYDMTSDMLMVNPITTGNEQVVEFAIRRADQPSATLTWQNPQELPPGAEEMWSRLFLDLSASTDYIVYARSAQSANFAAGVPTPSAVITTASALVTVTVDSVVTNFDALYEAFDFIQTNRSYTITLNQDQEINPTTIPAGRNITLVGNTNMRKIDLSASNGSMFTVDGQLTIGNNITLQGRSTNNTSLVVINNNVGTFIMQEGSVITGNTADVGGAVNSNGTFNMHGGTISNNHATIDAGGVRILGGTFNMHSGAIITNNTSAGSGGGVRLSFSTFNMHGGTISNNTVSSGSGGGVLIGTNAYLNMANGIIYGNDEPSNANSANNDVSLNISAGTAQHGYFTGDAFTSMGNLHSMSNTIEVQNGNLIRPSTASVNGTGFIDLAAALAYVASRPNDEHIVTITANQTLQPTTISRYSTNMSHRNVTIRSGTGSHTIQLDNTNGSMFNVSGATIILENVILRGRNDNNASLVQLNESGNLIMRNGSAVEGNNGGTNAGGVGLFGTSRLTMHDGSIIRGNTSNSSGGGVNLGSSTLHMAGGLITGTDFEHIAERNQAPTNAALSTTGSNAHFGTFAGDTFTPIGDITSTDNTIEVVDGNRIRPTSQQGASIELGETIPPFDAQPPVIMPDDDEPVVIPEDEDAEKEPDDEEDDEVDYE